MSNNITGFIAILKDGTHKSITKKAGTDDAVVAFEMWLELMELTRQFSYSQLKDIHDPDKCVHASEAM